MSVAHVGREDPADIMVFPWLGPGIEDPFPLPGDIRKLRPVLRTSTANYERNIQCCVTDKMASVRQYLTDFFFPLDLGWIVHGFGVTPKPVGSSGSFGFILLVAVSNSKRELSGEQLTEYLRAIEMSDKISPAQVQNFHKQNRTHAEHIVDAAVAAEQEQSKLKSEAKAKRKAKKDSAEQTKSAEPMEASRAVLGPSPEIPTGSQARTEAGTHRRTGFSQSEQVDVEMRSVGSVELDSDVNQDQEQDGSENRSETAHTRFTGRVAVTDMTGESHGVETMWGPQPITFAASTTVAQAQKILRTIYGKHVSFRLLPQDPADMHLLQKFEAEGELDESVECDEQEDDEERITCGEFGGASGCITLFFQEAPESDEDELEDDDDDMEEEDSESDDAVDLEGQNEDPPVGEQNLAVRLTIDDLV
ncbi:unnamed protein product [Amoebophrya sp. A120]|nr:unnamed protein product [Amoebophrya sp. A120]|eukprot:GSA120T00004100001.1